MKNEDIKKIIKILELIDKGVFLVDDNYIISENKK